MWEVGLGEQVGAGQGEIRGQEVERVRIFQISKPKWPTYRVYQSKRAEI
jgi:hypothetical protein